MNELNENTIVALDNEAIEEVSGGFLLLGAGIVGGILGFLTGGLVGSHHGHGGHGHNHGNGCGCGWN